jgi:GAF domain-containing protein
MDDHHSLDNLKLLRHINRSLRSNAEIREKLSEVVAAAQQLTCADSGIALLLSQDRQHIEVAASFKIDLGCQIALETSAIAQMILNSQQPEPVILWAEEASLLGVEFPAGLKSGDAKLLPSGALGGVYVPLLGHLKSIGGLLLFFRDRPVLEGTIADLLEVIASQAALVIEDTLLFAAADRMAEQMRLVNQVSLEIAAIHDLQTILNIIPNRLTETFGYYHASVGIVGPSGIEMYEASQHSRAVGPKRFSISLDARGMVPWVARQGMVHLANDTKQDGLWIPGKGLEASRSELTVPLIYRDRTIGVIDLQSEYPNAFDRDDVSVLEALGGQLAVAIENVRLLDENVRQRRTAETLSRVSRLVGGLLDLREVSQTVLDELKKQVSFDAALIALFEDNVFRIVHQTGYAEEDDPGNRWLVHDSPIFYRIVHYQEIVRMSDTAQDRLWQRGGPSSVRSWLGVPLLSRERPIGVLAIASSAPNVYDLSASRVLFTFANQIAVTLDNARLFEISEQREREARSLYEVTQSLVSLDQETMPLSLMENLSEAFQFDVAGILVGGVKNRLVMATRQTVPSPVLDEFEVRLRESFQTLSHQQIDQETLLRRVIRAGVSPDAAPVEQVPTRFSVTLLDGRSFIGILEIAKADPVPYSDAEIRALYILANLAATALENARLYQELMVRAASLQQFIDDLSDADEIN